MDFPRLAYRLAGSVRCDMDPRSNVRNYVVCLLPSPAPRLHFISGIATPGGWGRLVFEICVRVSPGNASACNGVTDTGSGLAPQVVERCFGHSSPPRPAAWGSDGRFAAKSSTAMAAGLPIMLITGSPSSAITRKAAELGLDRVLEKPPDEDDVLAFVNAARA
jgi:hypothetical protein